MVYAPITCSVGSSLLGVCARFIRRRPQHHTVMESKLFVRLSKFFFAYSAYALCDFCRKSLKVVDLKDILAKAEVAIQGKANKPDLIAKILASPEALKVYEQQYGSATAENASESHGPVSTKPASTAQVSDVHTPIDVIFTPSLKASAEQTLYVSTLHVQRYSIDEYS